MKLQRLSMLAGLICGRTMRQHAVENQQRTRLHGSTYDLRIPVQPVVSVTYLIITTLEVQARPVLVSASQQAHATVFWGRLVERDPHTHHGRALWKVEVGHVLVPRLFAPALGDQNDDAHSILTGFALFVWKPEV